MKRNILLFLVAILVSCNSTKRVEKALLTGDYSKAIDLALNQIQKGRDNTKTEEQKVILQKAFVKFQSSQLDRIDFLKSSPTQNEEEMYFLYRDLFATQKNIEPVLPLYHEGKKLKFKFEDINSELIVSKQNYAEYLYRMGQSYMINKDIMSYRMAFNTFDQLQGLMPDYKDANSQMIKAKELGTDYVFVDVFNNTDVALPQGLEDEILDFNTYGMQDQWTVYHANQQDGNPYQFKINLRFQTIIFSPERISEKEILASKEIEIVENQTDRNGNILRDNEGNALTYSRLVNVEGILNTINQEKLVSIIAQVDYVNLETDQKINDHKLDSQFLFLNTFATYDGDKRALNSDQAQLLKGQPVPFPTNEQMLYDAAEDIKNKLKSILQRHQLRA
jgi:hypothetical protein